MKSITLPNDIITTDSEVLLANYQASKESSKQQVNLAMNTFSFLQEGHKEVFADTKATAINNSDFLVMKSGHCLMTEKFSDTQNSYNSLLLFFSNEAVFRFARKYEIQLSKSTKRKTVQAISYDAFIQSFVQSLKTLEELPEASRNQMLEVKFEEIMLYLTESLGDDFLSSLMIDLDDHNYHFIDVVEHNKLNKLTLNELAFLSNMSLSTFKREFEKHFQSSPSKWFQEKRLEYAAFLLKNKSQRPSDIFQEVGYDSLTNFIQAFKAKFGKTPKQYQLN